MSVTVHGVLYTRINQTNTARVGTEDGSKNAVSSSYEGIVVIKPSVSIDKTICLVTEIGKLAFYYSKASFVVIPNTIKIMRNHCFYSVSFHIIIPASVTLVESLFIDESNPKITFCGMKEPETVVTDDDYWISNFFSSNVNVPLNYKDANFCLKNIAKNEANECLITEIKPAMLFTCKNRRNGRNDLLLQMCFITLSS